MSLARRAFLRMSFAALATTFLDIPLPLEPEDIVLAEVYQSIPRVHYKSTIYTLGFNITNEMMEDDMYSTNREVTKQLMTRWGMNDLYPAQVSE